MGNKYHYYEKPSYGREAVKHYYYHYGHSPVFRSSGFFRKIFLLGLGVWTGVYIAKNYEIRPKIEACGPPSHFSRTPPVSSDRPESK